MPRGGKRKKEDHSDFGRDEAAQEEKDESPDETSSVLKKMKGLKSLTFKIEHCKSWQVYKRNANQLSSELLQAFPSAKVLINDTKPRSKSFELTAIKEGGEELLLWTGIKKGPPRKLKFPVNTDLIEEVKKKL